MNTAISVRDLGKSYRLGEHLRHDTMRDLIGHGARSLANTFLRRSRNARSARTRPEEFWALRNVSFDVGEGQVVGVIGRNGAGKSTLLKLLSEITEPSEGEIRLRGRVASLLEVGTGFHPELTGRENIFLNGAILSMRRQELHRKLDQIVEFSGVEKFIDTPVKRYSSGMYVRLAFAVAAHLESEILLIDEVLAVGDITFQKKCLARLSGIAQSGRTVLFVSHNLQAVSGLCSRGIVLRQGEVAFDGEVGDAVRNYLETDGSVSSSYDIEPQDTQAKPGYAQRIEIENGSGAAARIIAAGDSWQVRVYFRITREVEHFIIALGLRTQLGQNLRTSWTDPATIKPGSYCAVFREDQLQLAAGQYSLIVGMSSFQRAFDYREDVGVLEIGAFSEKLQLPKLSANLILNQMATRVERLD